MSLHLSIWKSVQSSPRWSGWKIKWWFLMTHVTVSSATKVCVHWRFGSPAHLMEVCTLAKPWMILGRPKWNVNWKSKVSKCWRNWNSITFVVYNYVIIYKCGLIITKSCDESRFFYITENFNQRHLGFCLLSFN